MGYVPNRQGLLSTVSAAEGLAEVVPGDTGGKNHCMQSQSEGTQQAVHAPPPANLRLLQRQVLAMPHG